MGAHSPIAQLQQAPQTACWNLVTRIAFRFCFTYFGLFGLSTQILVGLFPITKDGIPDLDTFWPMRHGESGSVTMRGATRSIRPVL